MRLSWNEIRVRAADFAREWAGEGYEKGQTQLFYRDFFDVFGISVRRVASFEEPVKNLPGDKRGFIDLFWKSVLLVEQKSKGRNLNNAKEQALDYFPGLKESEIPRHILLSDFQTFELHDLEDDEQISFSLADLPDHVEKFGFIVGVQKRTFKDQDPVNIQASELVGQLHDALEEAGYAGHDLERFLVRIVFCLFADDTGVFERNSFLDFLENQTQENGGDLGPLLGQLFEVLDTPEDQRMTNLDVKIAAFPYINGALFHGPLRTASFDARMRRMLIEACQFDWSKISPAIFGALFQSVMNKEERRKQGAHYTTEKNIIKVIEPLFLNDLREEFGRLKALKGGNRRTRLEEFHQRLADLKFLDPACGCGNFLIITYRELRLLEIEIIRELSAYSAAKGTRILDIALLARLNVNQFYGIEIIEFPVRVAETALWMMDHIMNNRLSLEFGQNYVRIPLRESPHIVHEDALEIAWEKVLPPKQCDFVLGNPPFVGSKMQDERQRAQTRRIANLGKSGGTLDYVASWFIKAGEYVRKGKARVGFVATNSITQGEQVAQLWPLLFEHHKLEIAFAHRTFAWGSDARGKAHVHVVILGLAMREDAPKERLLFSYNDVNGEPGESRHAVLSPYLFDASRLANPHIVVHEVSTPLNGLPKLIIGSKPIDGGHYIFDAAQRDEFLAQEPGAEKFMRPYVGAKEFLQGKKRWILALHNAAPGVLSDLPLVKDRIVKVRQNRLDSESPPTNELAKAPTLYHVNVVPDEPFLVVPEVSSERRKYIPIAWLEPPVIPSNKVRIMENAALPVFALLTSAMHMSWMRCIGGRLESRFQYGIGVVYNTFPMPLVDGTALAKLEPLAQAVLDARAKHPNETLADLYDPDLMPVELRKAHRALDNAVDKLYRKTSFKSDLERAEHLLGLYEKMTAPLSVSARPEPKRRRKKAN